MARKQLKVKCPYCKAEQFTSFDWHDGVSELSVRCKECNNDFQVKYDSPQAKQSPNALHSVEHTSGKTLGGQTFKIACPYCGYTYTVSQATRDALTNSQSKLKCKQCGAKFALSDYHKQNLDNSKDVIVTTAHSGGDSYLDRNNLTNAHSDSSWLQTFLQKLAWYRGNSDMPHDTKIAISLLYTSLGIGALIGLIGVIRAISTYMKASSEVSSIILHIVTGYIGTVSSVLGMMWFLIFMISRRYDWARIVFLFLLVLGTPLSILFMQYVMPDILTKLGAILQLPLQITAAIFLFKRSSDNWFRNLERL